MKRAAPLALALLALGAGANPAAQETRDGGVDAAVARELLADVREWLRAPELPSPEDVRALREEAELAGAPRELVRELGNLGHRLDGAGRGAEARALVAWAAERAREGGDHDTRAWALDWLAQDAWGRGALDEAAELLARSADEAGARGARAEESRRASELARVRMAQGRLDEAEAAIERAEEAALASGSRAAERAAGEVRGGLLFELGRHRDALALCAELAELAEPLARDEIAVRLEILASDVLADVGRLDAAAARARRALELARTDEVRARAPVLYLEPRLSLALLLADLGRSDEALALLDESAADFARLGDARGAAWTDKNRGFALFAAGRFAEAVPAFERAWRAGDELGVPFLAGFGALGAAESLARTASGESARRGEATPRDEERLRAALEAAERVARESGERTLEWRCAALRGSLLLERGDHEAALAELRRAVARVERWRRRLGAGGLVEHALGQRSDPYRDAALAAAHLGRAEEALQLASLLWSRVQDELCARRDGPLPEPPAEVAELRERVARLAARARAGGGRGDELEAELSRAEEELDAALLDAELATGRSLAAPGERVPLARIGAALAAQGFDLALAYVVGERETLALTVAADAGTAAARIVPLGRKGIEERVARLCAPIARVEAGELDLAHLGFDVAAARELHDALVAPLALRAGARVALVADGALAALPLELLVSGGESGALDLARPFAHLAGLRFLGDHLVLVSYGSFARLLAQRAPPRGDAVVLVPPRPLGAPSGEEEARAIERALGGARIVAGARPEDVAGAARGARLVHFAAHGRVDDERPAHGHLVLGGEAGPADVGSGKAGSGNISAEARLEGWQAAGLALDGATVVLAACHGGRGEWRAGAGLAGLARGFLLGGAGEVVAAPWAVDDRAAARFMELLYAALARGEPTPDALASARSALRREADPRGFALAHPAFWAGWRVMR